MKGLDLSQIKTAEKREDMQYTTQTSSVVEYLFKKDIRLFPHRFSDKNKENFYLELYSLVSAGVEIVAVLELIEKEHKKADNKKLINQLREDLIKGLTLSEAMEKSSKFSAYEYQSIKIGEETGQLTSVLNELAKYYSKKIKQRRQLINAISYPVVVLITSVAAVTFMMFFIVPMFSDIFQRFGGELPYITSVIIDFSNFLIENAVYLILCVTGIATFCIVNKQKEWYKRGITFFIRRIPLIGKLNDMVYLARFCNSMSLLIGAKVPLLNAVKLVNKMISYYPLEVALNKVERDILQGKNLHDSMEEIELFDSKMITLIKVGEEVNQLDDFFKKLSERLSNNIEYQTSLISTFMEPLIIILLGAMVGFIMIAMYLPMFQLSTGIGG